MDNHRVVRAVVLGDPKVGRTALVTSLGYQDERAVSRLTRARTRRLVSAAENVRLPSAGISISKLKLSGLLSRSLSLSRSLVLSLSFTLRPSAGDTFYVIFAIDSIVKTLFIRIEFTIWDYSGDYEVYNAVSHILLSDKTIYILVVNLLNDTSLENWIPAMASRLPKT